MYSNRLATYRYRSEATSPDLLTLQPQFEEEDNLVYATIDGVDVQHKLPMDSAESEWSPSSRPG